MTHAPHHAGLPADIPSEPVDLDRRRALGRTTTPGLDGLDLDTLLDPEAHDLGWQEHALGPGELQFAHALPGLYAAAAPALTTSPHHRWLDGTDGGPADLVVDARQRPAWLLLPQAGHLTALLLEGPRVHRAVLPIAEWDLPIPPLAAWALEGQPPWLVDRTHHDLDGPLPRRAAAIGRLVRLREHRGGLAAVGDDASAPIRRWWRQLPLALLRRIEDQAVGAARTLLPTTPGLPLPLLLLRDDLESLRWMLHTHPGDCPRLDAVLERIDARSPLHGTADLDPQLAAASWRHPHAWWAAP